MTDDSRIERVTKRLRCLMVVAAAAGLLVACVPPPAPAAPPAPPPGPGPSSAGIWRIGYYAMWERLDPTPAEFPYETLTHVVIGNLVPTPNGCCVIPWDGSYAQPWQEFERDVVARAHAKGTKVLLMLGGEGGNPNSVWNTNTDSDNDAAVFAQAIVDYAAPRGYDGVDLDWEEGFQGNGVNLVRLARELRARWPQGVLTFPIAPLWNDSSDWSWVPAMQYLNRLNGMTYLSISDWGGWDGPWHLGAINEGADNPADGVHPYSLSRFVSTMTAHGVPRSKLGIGIGFFGACWTDSNRDGRFPTGPIGFAGEVGAALSDGNMTMGEIERSYRPSMHYVWDAAAQAPYLWSSPPRGGNPGNFPALGPCSYITFEDARSVREKGAWVKAQGLGGTIIWTVPQGIRADGSHPELDAVAASFG